MRILKNHKMYVRTNPKSDSVRNLAKLSAALYVFIYERFQQETTQKQYNLLNKEVKHWKDWQPLAIQLSEELTKELDRITKKKELTIYYNGSWRPLVKLLRYSE